jgi:hypothetical protein
VSARVLPGRRRRRDSFGFAIRDCAYDLYTQRRIVAAAIVNVIRRERRISFAKVACCWSLNQVSRRNAEMMRASVECCFIHQFAER